MARLEIDIGTTENDGTGDTVRAAFDKCNDNFAELWERPYVIGFFAGSTFDAGEILFVHKIKEDNTFTFRASDMSFTLEGATTASCSFSMTVNGVEVGTVDFGAADQIGTPTFTGGRFDADLDDVIKLIAPDPADTTAGGLSVTLLGFRPLVPPLP